MTTAATSTLKTPASQSTGVVAPLGDGFSQQVAAAFEGWQFDMLPDDVVNRVKLFVLDTLGVIAAARDAEGISALNRRYSEWEGSGPSTALLGKWRASPPTAAMVNGAAAHALDFDDNHDPGRVHAYSVMLPAALAAAEQRCSVGGREFIAALATGVELQARLGLSAPNSMPLGWHPTTVMGALGAAASVARILGLRGEQFASAIGLAYHQASGTRQALNDGVLAKRLGPGFAARNGVTAAYLAASGLTGPTRFLEGEAGLFNLYERGQAAPERLLDGLRTYWEIMTHSMKPYPCCRCTHNAIAIGEELHAEGIRSEAIESVTIGLGKTNTLVVGAPYDVGRNSTIHAQFNACYCFAAALVRGKVDLASFRQPQITESETAALAARSRVEIDEAIPAAAMSPTRLTVLMRDGARIQRYREFMEGSPDQPMSVSDSVAKFAACLTAGLRTPLAEIDALAERVLQLENCDDVGEIVALFPAPRDSDS